MIIGRKDRERVTSMETKIAAQNTVRLLNRIERDEQLETVFGDMYSI